MKALNLNDLPEWSPWPSRLLGMDPWRVPKRTIEKVDSEYDKDKYAKCLAYYTTVPVSVEAIRQFEHGNGSACVALGNDLVVMTLSEAQLRYSKLLTETMYQEIEQSATVIELGCGYGYNLWMLKQSFRDKHFCGGEYSENAVCLASHLFHEDSAIGVSQFNFYDRVYGILESAKAPITVFTSHAIEQLPHAASFFQALLQHRDKIKAVFHFEPVCELHDSTLLGLMRRRYAEVNDYNRDLLSELQRWSDDIRIVHTEAGVFGLNPLNPTSVVHWEFVQEE